MWDEVTYQFPNFNSCTVEIWEWINNLIPHIKQFNPAHYKTMGAATIWNNPQK